MDKQVYEYISQQTNDPIVERKTCSISGKEFAVFQSDINFYRQISPIFDGQKFQIPIPTLCPEERQRRRLAWRNERKLYRRTCDATGKSIISIYSPDKPYTVYDQKFWRSDNRDPLEYGQIFDISKTFTEQFYLLLRSVPHNALYSTNPSNSEYTNFALNDKNCYLVFGWWNNEDCYYCNSMSNSSNNVDGFSAYDCNECYSIICAEKCFDCYYVTNCSECSRCIYVEDCQWCENCIMCFGLVNKKNHFLNKPVSTEQIQQLKDTLANISQNDHPVYQQYLELKQTVIHRASHNFSSELVWWEMIVGSKNCYNCHAIQNCEDCRNITFMHNAQNTRDSDYASPFGANNSYNICSSTGTCNSAMVFLSWNNSYLYYSAFCFDCQNCFGCVGLRNKQYCIFNTQYSKEEYESEVWKIIWRMIETWERGEFFHPSISPFGYNETVAHEYLPQEKSVAISHGYNRSDYETETQNPSTYELVDWQKKPDLSLLSDDQIANQIYLCEVSWKPYRILKQELLFYRKHKLPIPRRHPDQRHLDRMQTRSWRALHIRKCDKTNIDILSLYPDTAAFPVYSEQAYTQEFYG